MLCTVTEVFLKIIHSKSQQSICNSSNKNNTHTHTCTYTHTHTHTHTHTQTHTLESLHKYLFLEWNYQLFPRLKNIRESIQFIVYLWVLRNFNSEAQCSIEQNFTVIRGGSRTAATSKMEQSITKRSILDVAAALDPPLVIASPKLYLLIPCLRISFLFFLCTLN